MISGVLSCFKIDYYSITTARIPFLCLVHPTSLSFGVNSSLGSSATCHRSWNSKDAEAVDYKLDCRDLFYPSVVETNSRLTTRHAPFVYFHTPAVHLTHIPSHYTNDLDCCIIFTFFSSCSPHTALCGQYFLVLVLIVLPPSTFNRPMFRLVRYDSLATGRGILWSSMTEECS